MESISIETELSIHQQVLAIGQYGPHAVHGNPVTEYTILILVIRISKQNFRNKNGIFAIAYISYCSYEIL